MPIYLEPTSDLSALYEFTSVLIVLCPMCPAVSLAVRDKKPYMEFVRHVFGTASLDEHLEKLKDDLEGHGVRTGFFTSYLPLPLMCLWSEGQRGKLAKAVRGYEAVAIVGCDAATVNAANVLEGTGVKLVQVMEVAGIVTAIPKLERPFNLTLKITGKDSVAWPRQAPRT